MALLAGGLALALLAGCAGYEAGDETFVSLRHGFRVRPVPADPWRRTPDVADILAASDLSIDGSHVGLGITGSLRESLAMETPAVATAAMGNPELVLHEGTGLLVPPRDPGAMAAAALRLLGDPAWARALGRAGRLRVVERFSTRAKVEQLEALYARLAESA